MDREHVYIVHRTSYTKCIIKKRRKKQLRDTKTKTANVEREKNRVEEEQLEVATVYTYIVFVAWAITILARWTFNALSNQRTLIHRLLKSLGLYVSSLHMHVGAAFVLIPPCHFPCIMCRLCYIERLSATCVTSTSYNIVFLVRVYISLPCLLVVMMFTSYFFH